MHAVTLCRSCSSVRLVAGRRGQTYLLCRNPAIPAKYPRQPVRSCPGYEPAAEQGTARAAAREGGV